MDGLSVKLNEVCRGCGLKCTKELRTGTTPSGKAIYADPCMGILPGVHYGCCGHGDGTGYLAFENGVIVRFFTETVEHKKFSRYHAYNEQTTTRKC